MSQAQNPDFDANVHLYETSAIMCNVLIVGRVSYSCAYCMPDRCRVLKCPLHKVSDRTHCDGIKRPAGSLRCISMCPGVSAKCPPFSSLATPNSGVFEKARDSTISCLTASQGNSPLPRLGIYSCCTVCSLVTTRKTFIFCEKPFGHLLLVQFIVLKWIRKSAIRLLNIWQTVNILKNQLKPQLAYLRA